MQHENQRSSLARMGATRSAACNAKSDRLALRLARDGARLVSDLDPRGELAEHIAERLGQTLARDRVLAVPANPASGAGSKGALVRIGGTLVSAAVLLLLALAPDSVSRTGAAEGLESTGIPQANPMRVPLIAPQGLALLYPSHLVRSLEQPLSKLMVRETSAMEEDVRRVAGGFTGRLPVFLR